MGKPRPACKGQPWRHLELIFKKCCFKMSTGRLFRRDVVSGSIIRNQIHVFIVMLCKAIEARACIVLRRDRIHHNLRPGVNGIEVLCGADRYVIPVPIVVGAVEMHKRRGGK